MDLTNDDSIDGYLKIFVEFSKQSSEAYFEKESQQIIKHALHNKKKLLELLNKTNMITIHHALMYSIHIGMIKISKAIIKKYTAIGEMFLNINFNRCEAFRCALYYNRIELLNVFLNAGVNVHIDHDIALIKYCHLRNVEVVSLLIDFGANMNINDGALLIHCASCGYLDIINLFARKGLEKVCLNHVLHCEGKNSVNSYDVALIAASRNNHYFVAVRLLHLGANANANQAESLIVAAEKGYYRIVKLLLDNGANPNSFRGRALKLAVINEHWDIIKCLSEHKNKRNDEFTCDLSSNNSIALKWACHKGNAEIVKFLLDCKFDDGVLRCIVNEEAKFLANKCGNKDIISLLNREKT